jgi:AraC family transcriptional regulator of arabinose operon
MPKVSQGFTGQRLLILPFFVVEEMGKDELLKDLYIHSIGHYPNAEHHFFARPDGCAENILIYCAKGEGWFELNGKKHIVSENQVFILPANEPHSYGADKSNPWSIYWIHFKGNKAEYYASGFATPVNVTSRIEYRIALFNEIYDTLKQGYNKENLMYACSTLCHFLGLFKYLIHFGEEKSDNEFGTSIIHWATHYMNENIDKQLKLEDLSAFTAYSPSHIHRLFYKTTGYAPMQYFLHLKMDRACYYLSHTSYKINQIAQILGFKDAYHFSKLFSKLKKVSPSLYRKQEVEGQ